MSEMIKRFLLGLLRFYQLTVSPAFALAFGIHCRYEESCSRYAQRMISSHGVWRGVALGLKRFLSCNPWHHGKG